MNNSVLGLLFALLVTPCMSNDDDIVCTEEFVYGVSVTVTDAESNEPVTDATLTLTDGEYTEVMEHFGSGQYGGAGERPGTYTLRVDAEGYESKTTEQLVVTAGICHVNPVVLDISLPPSQAD
jgi:hypothetical protein